MKDQYLVCIVDADEDTQYLLDWAFQQVHPSYLVRYFTSADELYAYLDTASIIPNLILIDYYLPICTGLTLVEELRSNPLLRSTLLLLFITPDVLPERSRWKKAGSNGHYTKPTSFQQWRRLTKQLDRHVQ